MIERFSVAPWSFWLHLLVLALLTVEGLRKWRLPWAKPALVIYGTVAFWYTADFLLSSAISYETFSEEVIVLAFLQVTLFLVVFRFAIGGFSRFLCEKPLREARTQALTGHYLTISVLTPRLLRRLLVALILAWLVIFAFGASFSPESWKALLWPPLHHEKVGMYPLTGLGGGMSFFYNTLSYMHILVCALFGVLSVMARGPVRWIAAAMALVSWPYFWFDWARNKMLALLLPGLAAFILVGKSSIKIRVAVTLLFCLALVVWFAKVADYRTQRDLAVFLESNVGDDEQVASMRRAQGRIGQDMLKELCWVNTFIPSGRYQPNWGLRYFAEIVNPIPRSIWPNKPTVGIDYSIARGFGGARTEHGVFATIATGMIGQGCVNFGRFFGPPAAALLFALWAAFLARLWCQRASPFRLALFLVGLGLTLNTGRDLTFLVLFPFLFGYVSVRIHETISRTKPNAPLPAPDGKSAPSPPPPR